MFFLNTGLATVAETSVRSLKVKHNPHFIPFLVQLNGYKVVKILHKDTVGKRDDKLAPVAELHMFVFLVVFVARQTPALWWGLHILTFGQTLVLYAENQPSRSVLTQTASCHLF